MKKTTLWNTNKPGGWKKFYEYTESNLIFNKIINEEVNPDPEKLSKVYEKELTKAKFSAFGKVSYGNTHRENKNKKLETLQKKKMNSNNAEEIESINIQIIEEIETIRRTNLEKEFEELRNIKNKKGKIAAVFKLKESVTGSKKSEQEPTVLINADTKKEVADVSEIKKIMLSINWK